MKTLEKYEAKRNVKPTIFQPSHLSEYKIVSYIAGNGIGINKNVDTNLLKQIRKTDTFMTKGIDLKTADEQAMIQQWFRQQIKQQIDIEQ